MSGTVTISDAGVASGSGSALALYNAIVATEAAFSPLPDPEAPDDDWDGTAAEWRTTFLTHVVKTKRAWARIATAHAGVPIHMHLSAVSANTTLDTGVNSNLSIPVLAGEIWMVQFVGQVTCNGAGGVKLGLSGPAGAVITLGETWGVGATNLNWSAQQAVTLGTTYGAYSAAASGTRMARLDALVTVGGTAGNIAVQYASVTAGQTSTIAAGSRLKAWRSVGV